MKRSMIAVLLVAAMVVAASVAQASITTITFNGSDLVAPASLTVNTTGTPTIGDGYIALTTGAVRTYNKTSTPTAAGDPAAFNAWLGQLNEGEGIYNFNLWLQDGHSDQATMWGETIALNDALSTDIHPFASAGWTAAVETAPASWGTWWAGRQIITYTANTEADYLRPGSTATFGFTADIVGYNGGTSPYQMWTGGYVVDDVVATDGMFQRAVTANAVPEPAAVTVWSLLGLVAGGFGLWRRKRAA